MKEGASCLQREVEVEQQNGTWIDVISQGHAACHRWLTLGTCTCYNSCQTGDAMKRRGTITRG